MLELIRSGDGLEAVDGSSVVGSVCVNSSIISFIILDTKDVVESSSRSDVSICFSECIILTSRGGTSRGKA